MTTERSAELRTRITDIVRRVGRCPASMELDGQKRLVEDLGIDSLDLVGIYVEVQDQFEVEFDDAEVEGSIRIDDLVFAVARRIGPGSDPQVVAA